MLLPTIVTAMFGGLLTVLGVDVAYGQNYPTKPIRIVNSGGASDFISRLIAPVLSANMGQPIIIDNRSDIIAREIVAKAPPDGYNLHITGTGLWVEPLLRKLSYDPVKDFSPITLATTSPNVLVVQPSFAAKSVKELIALAKAKPRELNFASGGTGGSAHMAGELFKTMAGVDIVHVPYKNPGLGLVALIGGEVQLMFATAVAVAPHVKSGKLRAMAVASAQPSALAPGLPTMTASGMPGFESAATQSVFGPAKTPASIITRLNQEIVRIINGAEMKEQLFNAGLEVVGSSPDQLRTTIEVEMARLGKVIKDAGIRGE